MTITNFLVMDGDGNELIADPFGNNVAFCCPKCRHAILAIARETQRGGDENHPAQCRGCESQYFLDVRPQSQKLYVIDLAKFNRIRLEESGQ